MLLLDPPPGAAWAFKRPPPTLLHVACLDAKPKAPPMLTQFMPLCATFTRHINRNRNRLRSVSVANV